LGSVTGGFPPSGMEFIRKSTWENLSPGGVGRRAARAATQLDFEVGEILYSI